MALKITRDVMTPWLIASPTEVYWIGLTTDERHAWDVALGWPDESEINAKKAEGFKAHRLRILRTNKGALEATMKAIPDGALLDVAANSDAPTIRAEMTALILDYLGDYGAVHSRLKEGKNDGELDL